jgi:hypothetical protein
MSLNNDAIISPPSLDFSEIVAAARTTSGLNDIDVPDLFEALNVLIKSLNTEGHLTPAGMAGKRAGLLRSLANRFRLERTLELHPEIKNEDISGPIVIIGLPRSGTTKLHRMIAADPGLQKLPLWKLLNPVPIGNFAQGEPDPRIAIAEVFEKTMRETQPDLYAAHPMAALEPDEDVFALEVTGRNYINCSTVPATSYKAWLDKQPFDGVYRLLRHFLQVVQYFDRGAGKPWVLKAPQHMGFLPLIFDVFPQATIVHCHRPVAVSVASYAAMITVARKSSCSVADPFDVGQYALTFWSDLTERYLRDRTNLEMRHKFIDLSYRDIVNNGIESVSRIYATAGLEMSNESRESMLAWEHANAQHKHGRHRYELADAGLTEQDIATAFSGYTAKFSDYF